MATGLELPAAIIGIAGVVGIADVAIKSIVTVYRDIKELHDVPDEVEAICTEITTLNKAIGALDFLKTADETVKTTVKDSGLPHALQQCGKACDDLEKDLKLWTAKGVHKLRSKIKVKSNKAKIERYLANIRRASDFVVLAQLSVLLGIKVAERSACVDSQVAGLQQKFTELTMKAKKNYQGSEEDKQALRAELAKDLGDLEEMDVEAALEEKEAEGEVYKDTMAKSAIIARSTVQTIGDVRAGDMTNIEVGMPASVVEHVAEQTIGDVTVGDMSTGRVGIYAQTGL